MTLTREEASQLALATAQREFGYPSDSEELVILHQWTVESPLAWAFVFNTRAFAETGDVMRGLMGNGPVIVFKETGHAELMPSGHSASSAIAEVERRSVK